MNPLIRHFVNLMLKPQVLRDCSGLASLFVGGKRITGNHASLTALPISYLLPDAGISPAPVKRIRIAITGSVHDVSRKLPSSYVRFQNPAYQPTTPPSSSQKTLHRGCLSNRLLSDALRSALKAVVASICAMRVSCRSLPACWAGEPVIWELPKIHLRQETQ